MPKLCKSIWPSITTSNLNGSTPVTTTPSVCTKLATTKMPQSIFISIAFCAHLQTKTTSMDFGENWPQTYWCKSGIRPWKIWKGFNNILMNQLSGRLFKLCNKELGWSIGLCLFSSITKKDEIWSLNCFCIKSRTLTPFRPHAHGFSGTCPQLLWSTKVPEPK